MKTISKILFIALLLLAIAHTGWASQLADLPPGQPITLPEVDSLISQVAQFLLVVSVLIAVIMIVWSGITYMYAGADATKVTAAQGRFKSAVIGAAIVLGVGVIIQTIAGIVTRDFFCQFQLLGVCIIR
ncbi:MAG: hypothetical protein A3I26_02765 [Candidatus Yanofskybacteria bacterium RIFCSPLOWO2_02_FULL_43_10]|uniref:Uncharacterized protein n=1 Tax=Candidatus Yanofskybacteria bacterium RIFCSPLOWO2_12_FULL_43_11b TaxID=1802710 RepID=A0A1F8HA85_9BACT|nr:MAG: hypothetical protein A2742_01690 [Candidatus Yanofskybacteria bacterium RIFCSPHIGHO2_01_FULL_43_32]OGN11707.1 MAG: hypothetical protein A3C69_04050 [Candidatus Yanofskybacteria bacterium RIFCSPHIGHO2_02_FULL_43_12]OGN18093.1 MAG: hypothetical protein A3E34_02390 [Candidatus Yanofskybacteria bacterium RIFCSPHIGHO2_12_FULL_43_11]OGN25319.1 MAG: hypothetical protein A2923_01480 [Candidatus Yanofskybacteria bacterium RIFCSPLOWO2_01_FULL_43_46]OGN28604.1 MAG: hypothetical protein A3I26_02765